MVRFLAGLAVVFAAGGSAEVGLPIWICVVIGIIGLRSMAKAVCRDA